ncbi:MAG: hypothetical protein ACR2IF_04450 [Terriglobales bacterium]
MPTATPEKAQTAPEVRFNAPSRWPRAAVLLCELALLAFVVRQLWWRAAELARHLSAPFQFDYEEGNILNALARIAHGLSPYPDPRAFPNVLNPYGPAAYYVLAAPVKLFGISFFGPRLVIAASLIATCSLLGLLIVRLGGSKLAAFLFASMYAALAVVQAWSAVLRVDFLALALTSAGLCLFTIHCNTEDTDAAEITEEYVRKNPSVCSVFSVSSVLSLLFFVAALLIKPTFLAAPAACLLWLLAHKSWRQALRFVAAMAALLAAALAITLAATHGYFFTHFFLTHPDPFSWSVYLTRMSGVLVVHRALVALAAVWLISDVVRRRASLPSLWLLMATVTAITAGKLGSGWNHFLEWPAALCLCAALGWTQMVRIAAPANRQSATEGGSPLSHPLLARQGGAFLSSGPVLPVVALVAATAWLCLFIWQQKNLSFFDEYNAVSECPQAYAYIAQHGGDRVLSENVGALVLAGKTVWVSNPFVYSQLVMRRGWHDVGLEKMVRDGGFELIVASRNYPAYPWFRSDGAERFSAAGVNALAANYRVAKTFQCRDAAVMFERGSP